mmetsp:Transcript_94984/g.211156  ORF Transcript_94984/g.211156 Transcript_94984/m.211156 type:complete len:369 (-) Transcript_94984:1762-2868(-)
MIVGRPVSVWVIPVLPKFIPAPLAHGPWVALALRLCKACVAAAPVLPPKRMEILSARLSINRSSASSSSTLRPSPPCCTRPRTRSWCTASKACRSLRPMAGDPATAKASEGLPATLAPSSGTGCGGCGGGPAMAAATAAKATLSPSGTLCATLSWSGATSAPRAGSGSTAAEAGAGIGGGAGGTGGATVMSGKPSALSVMAATCCGAAVSGATPTAVAATTSGAGGGGAVAAEAAVPTKAPGAPGNSSSTGSNASAFSTAASSISTVLRTASSSRSRLRRSSSSASALSRFNCRGTSCLRRMTSQRPCPAASSRAKPQRKSGSSTLTFCGMNFAKDLTWMSGIISWTFSSRVLAGANLSVHRGSWGCS